MLQGKFCWIPTLSSVHRSSALLITRFRLAFVWEMLSVNFHPSSRYTSTFFLLPSTFTAFYFPEHQITNFHQPAVVYQLPDMHRSFSKSPMQVIAKNAVALEETWTTQVAHTLHHTQLLTLNESQRHNVTSTYHDHCKDFVWVCSPIIPDADSHYKTMLCIARNTECKSLKYSFPSPLNYEYLHNNQVQKRRKNPTAL